MALPHFPDSPVTISLSGKTQALQHFVQRGIARLTPQMNNGGPASIKIYPCPRFAVNISGLKAPVTISRRGRQDSKIGHFNFS
jgi:hypothetical protein